MALEHHEKNQIWIDHINALTWNGCFYWDSYQCNSHRSSDMSKWGRSTLSRFQINWFVAWVAWNVVTMWYPHHSRPTQTTHELWRNSWLVDIHLFRWTSKDSIADDWIFSATCFVKKKTCPSAFLDPIIFNRKIEHKHWKSVPSLHFTTTFLQKPWFCHVLLMPIPTLA